MAAELRRANESRSADLTHVRSFPRVYALVFDQVRLLGKSLEAEGARKRTFAVVDYPLVLAKR